MFTAAAVAARSSIAERAIVGWALRSVPRDGNVASALGPGADDGVEIVLVVGNDDRALAPADAADAFGPLTGRRADAVILVAVDRAHDEVRALSLPRDLTVDTDQYGPLLLGEAFGFGGAELLATSIEQLTGVTAQHYVEWSFGGFAELIDELGGLDIEFCRPTRDVRTGLNVPAGVNTLDGEEALALVRSRRYERLDSDTWVDGGQGDRERVERQQAVWAMLVQRLRDDIGLRDLVGLVRSTGSLVVADPRLGADDLLDLVEASRSGTFATRSMSAVPIRTQDERRSPFGHDHLGGRLYLQPALGAGDNVRWLLGTDAMSPSPARSSVGRNTFAPSPRTAPRPAAPPETDRELDDDDCI